MIADIASSLLTPCDIAALARLGISSTLLVEARVQRVTDREARDDFGIKGPATMEMNGIIFPYFIPAVSYRVTARLRRDYPEIENGKTKNKYISPHGDGRHLYFPPGAAAKLERPEMPSVSTSLAAPASPLPLEENTDVCHHHEGRCICSLSFRSQFRDSPGADVPLRDN